MNNSKLIKLSIIFLSFLYLQIAFADDTEIFLGSNSSPIDPKVLFIFDNSGSMDDEDVKDPDGNDVSRMSVAKKALLDIIFDSGNADLDIGLMQFNKNSEKSGGSSNNGGRIVFAINDITSTNRGTEPLFDYSGDGVCCWGQWAWNWKGKKYCSNDSPPADSTLAKKICDINSSGYTPLEETLYEAYLYYRGLNAVYGDQNRNPVFSPVEPTGDTRKDGTYYSPILEDPSFQKYDNDGNGSINIADLSCETANIVLMTDGSPTEDDDSHSSIRTLTSDADCETGTGKHGNCLDELSKYMYQSDLDGNSSNDKQNIITHTVGFKTNQTLLKNTAEKGGGKYFTANNASELSSAFEEIFGGINDSAASFSSPSGSSSSTNDAQSLDYIYSNVFKPAATPRWNGNLKKYRLETVPNGFEDPPTNSIPKMVFSVVDVNDNIVYDENGEIISNAKGNKDGNGNTYDVKSIWSISTDTDVVTLGGAGESIDSYNLRKVYTNADTSKLLTATENHFKTTNTNLTYTQFNAANDTEKNKLINWALGLDTEDEDEDGSTSDARPWVMGDSLHSKATVINYGKRENNSDYEGDFPDLRIVMGTNAGFLHFFKDDLGGASNNPPGGVDDSVEESWAFIPTELFKNIKDLNVNSANTPHRYGIDGEIAVYQYDAKQDGKIVSSEGDRVIIVFGMRRGGAYYYALDVTDPDAPKYLWKFTDSEILQTWSTPEFGKIKYFDGSAVQIKTVAIFTAGYDTDKDAKATVGTNDDNGRGLYIVDLFSGSLIWSVKQGSATSTPTTLYESTLNDSIPASPRSVDINDDDILDRIYMPDTGGNVWRIDLFNQDVDDTYTPGDDSRSEWSIFKFANLGRGDVSSLANDRRFFNQIDFVQTRDSNGNFDAVLLGSGHRNNPNETAVQNRFYMLKDPNVVAYKFQSGDCETDTASPDYDPYCMKIPAALINNDLDNATSSALTSYSTDGWRMDLGSSGEGEKNLSSSVTINGKVSFTTYSPKVSPSTLCVPKIGSSYTYGVNLHSAGAAYDFDGDGTVESDERKKTNKQPGIPSKPGLYSPDGRRLYIVPGLGEEPMFTGNLQTQIYYRFKNSE